MAATNMFLDYTAINLIAKIRYHASNMQLYTYSDASYLSKPKACSRGAEFFFLSNHPSKLNLPPNTPPPLNGALHIVCKIMRNVMDYATEAKTAAAYMTTQEAVPI